MQKVNVGCGPHYVQGWVNTDIVETEDIKPDIIDSDLSSFEDESVDMLYLGHILEHIPWEDVPEFIVGVNRILKPSGTLLVVGPDVVRALGWWRATKINNKELYQIMEWDELEEVPEGAQHGSRHFWNCTEARVIKVLSPHFNCQSVNIIDPTQLKDWPIVSRVGWQCAILATKK
jgi:hypothetical protein